MASVWAGRTGCLLLVAAIVIMPALVSSQLGSTPVKSIANPDFPCGLPYGANGEPPASSRVVRRQIFFPDDPKYHHYLGQLLPKPGPIGVREGEVPAEPEPEKDDGLGTFCGASVISDRFLITAAHCVYDSKKPIGAVRLGDLDLSDDTEKSSKPVTHEIAYVIAHPAYNPEKRVRHYDLALLATKEKIQFNDVVFPYCISDETPPPGTMVSISGYGLYNATYRPAHLLEGNFTVMDTAECEQIYLRNNQEDSLRLRYPNLLQNTDIICAIDDVVDACQGDSGGPVFLYRDGKRYLEGLVSGGANCRANFKSELPGLYLSLAKYIGFIDHFMASPPPETT